MQDYLMLSNGTGSSPAMERDELVITSSNTRATLSLLPSGLHTESNVCVLDFSDVVGVSRDGAKLSYFAYPRVVGIAASCCANGEEKRERVVTSFVCDSEATAKRWETSSWSLLQEEFVKTKGRHVRRFLVLLNPRSGKGLSEKIFQEHCAPMFRDAAVEYTLVKTEFSGHANKYCKETPDLAQKFDGIVIVSGDGLLFEVLQGVMTRPDWADVVKDVAFGIVPGGSGNGLAVTLAHASGEKRGPLSNTFLIAKGNVAPLDLCAVDHFGKGRLYSFLSLEFGFIADVDLGSDWMRSLGEVRFTLQVIRLLFSPSSTPCRLSYLPTPGNPKSPKTAPKTSNYWETDSPYTGPEGPRVSHLVPLSSPLPTSWESVTDRFFTMWPCNVAWMSSSSQVSPHSHWNDGYIQLLYYRKSKSRMARLNLLRFVLAIETGSHVKEDGSSTFGAFEMFPVRAFRIEPLKKTGTRLAVDGEEVEMGPLQMEVLPGIARLMGTSVD